MCNENWFTTHFQPVYTSIVIEDLDAAVCMCHSAHATLDRVVREALRKLRVLHTYTEFFAGPLDICVQGHTLPGTTRLVNLLRSRPDTGIVIRLKEAFKKCVANEVPVLMENGEQIPISRLQPGDEVTAWDFDRNLPATSKVISVISGTVTQGVEFNRRLVTSIVETVVTNQGPKPVTTIQLGDLVATPQGFEIIEDIRYIAHELPVRSLIVEPHGTFFAGGLLLQDLLGGTDQ